MVEVIVEALVFAVQEVSEVLALQEVVAAPMLVVALGPAAFEVLVFVQKAVQLIEGLLA